MRVTSTSACLSAWAAKRPPKPVPTITTRGRPVGDALPACSATGDVVMMNPVSHSGGPRPRQGQERSGTQCPCPAAPTANRKAGRPIPASRRDQRGVGRPYAPSRARPRSRPGRPLLGPVAPPADRGRRPAAGHGPEGARAVRGRPGRALVRGDGGGPARGRRPLAELPGRGRGRRRPTGQRDRAVRADDGPPAALAPRAAGALAGDGAARAAVAVPAGAGAVAAEQPARDG